jgi:hypothetical protein
MSDKVNKFFNRTTRRDLPIQTASHMFEAHQAAPIHGDFSQMEVYRGKKKILHHITLVFPDGIKALWQVHAGSRPWADVTILDGEDKVLNISDPVYRVNVTYIQIANETKYVTVIKSLDGESI